MRILLSVLAAILCGCTSLAQSPEAELAWLDTADAARMFADSARAGRLRFVVVCGYACGTPALGTLTYAHCYAHAASVVDIDRTGHVILSARHAELKAKAYGFAKRYNSLILAALDRQGRRRCPPEERWDDYWRALDSLAKRIPAHPFESFVMAITELRSREPDFQLHVQAEVDLSPEIYRQACALAPRYGIAGRVRFAVTTGNINDRPKRHRGFTCVRGAVAG